MKPVKFSNIRKTRNTPINEIIGNSRIISDNTSIHSYNTRKRRRDMMNHNMPVEVHIMLDYPTRRRRIQKNVKQPEPIRRRKSMNILCAIIILCWIWLLDESHQTTAIHCVYDGMDMLMKINWVGLFNIVRTYGIDAVNTMYFIGLNILDLLGDGLDLLSDGWTEWVEYLWLLNLNTDWNGVYILLMSEMCNIGMLLHFGLYVGIGLFMVMNV